MTRRWKRRIEVYVDDETWEQVQKAAARTKLSSSSWAKVAIAEKLDREHKMQGL